MKRCNAGSTEPGETSVSVPLLVLSKRVGAINLKCRQPHPSGFCEFEIQAWDVCWVPRSGFSNCRTKILISACNWRRFRAGERHPRARARLERIAAYLVLERQSRPEESANSGACASAVLDDPWEVADVIGGGGWTRTIHGY